MLIKHQKFEKSELLSLMSSTPTLAGLCVTIVAITNTLNKPLALGSMADDIFAFCALGFVICTMLIFLGLRVETIRQHILFIIVIDIIFAVSLLCMAIATFMLLYSIV